MRKHALRKYLVTSGLTKVVKRDGLQYKIKGDKAVVEAIAAGIDQMEFRLKGGESETV